MILKPKQICYLSEMRKILSLFSALDLLVKNHLPAPLIFKITNEVEENGEIAKFDLSKYKKIFVGAMFVGDNDNSMKTIKYFAEDNDRTYLGSFEVHTDLPEQTVLIENLPSKLSFVAEKAGTYKVYIWAE